MHDWEELYRDWQKKAQRTMPLEQIENQPSDAPDIASSAADRETANQILRHLHQLEEPYKEVFLLHALGDIPLVQISRLFGKSDSWARVTYYRAKTMIQKRMEGENESATKL